MKGERNQGGCEAGLREEERNGQGDGKVDGEMRERGERGISNTAAPN